jgi:tetratricopeptide (TPR) repeat protein
MSFDLICKSCGATSNPSTGVCPFCKSVMASSKPSKESATVTRVRELYSKGKIDKALQMAKMAEQHKPKLLDNPNFVVLYVQILIEVDGPSSKIKSLIARCLLENPDHSGLLEYLEVADAESRLSKGFGDAGELELANVIRRSPKNEHALFLLGSHLFWIEKETQRSVKLLERAYKQRPNFLRCTACLAALYVDLGYPQFAKKLFRRCASLDSSKEMKKFFNGLID